jgi:large subunit ribosomal protein L21
MKKAVITTGGKQYIVSKDDELDVELLGDQKTVTFEPLLIFDEKDTKVGNPVVKGATVKAEVVDADFKTDKAVIMKFQSKKRVKTLTGHRQRKTRIKITSIA